MNKKAAVHSVSFFPYVIGSTPTLPCIEWTSDANTVAGGNGSGIQLNQLDRCSGIFVDDDGTVLIADYCNHRIMEWKPGATSGQVIAGGRGEGNALYQLNKPSDIIIDRERNSLLICDLGNRRIVRWPRQNGQKGETIIGDIDCSSLAIDNYGFLYIVDTMKDEVRRYRPGGNSFATSYTIVAGGHGEGKCLNQFYGPTYLFVDSKQTVYVSDKGNNRVMKWIKDAKEGVVVAGGKQMGNSLTQLDDPQGLYVDSSDTVYVADYRNHRITCWHENSDVTVILGGHDSGDQAHKLNRPSGLSLDRYGNLYIADSFNHRIQRLNVKSASEPISNITPSKENVWSKEPGNNWSNITQPCRC